MRDILSDLLRLVMAFIAALEFEDVDDGGRDPRW